MRRCNVDSEMSIAHAETRNCFGGHSHFTVHARTSVVLYYRGTKQKRQAYLLMFAKSTVSEWVKITDERFFI